MFLVFRIFLASAALAGLMFYAAASTPDAGFRHLLEAFGAVPALIALQALRWMWRGLVAFFR